MCYGMGCKYEIPMYMPQGGDCGAGRDIPDDAACVEEAEEDGEEYNDGI